MSHCILVALVCVALGWASSVSAQAPEKPAKTDRMERFTYPIADLIVPIRDHSVFSDSRSRKEEREITKDALAAALVKRITDSVARGTWESAGGQASIQYFPMGLAIVVNHRDDVHKEIMRLLADLRRMQDVQVSMEVRCIQTSPHGAKQIRAVMDSAGAPVRAWNIEKPAQVGRFVSVDEKQVLGLLELAQTDRAAVITQSPKLTVYNGQQAGVGGLGDGAGVRFDVWPVVAADQQSVRFALQLEYGAPKVGKIARPALTEAIGTFAVPANRSLIWHVSETLFVLATPRVIIVEQEENVFLGNMPPIPGRGGEEEQSAPEPRKPANQPSLKERVIQYRLKQPISLSFKDTPLREAIQSIAIQSGIQVVPDHRALQEAKINMEAPLSGSAGNIAMKSALAILLKPMRLTWIVEDEVLKITPEDRQSSSPVRRVYKVGDLVDPLPTVEGEPSRSATEVAAELKTLIANTIARNSWEEKGGTGVIQYFPMEKTLVITHCQEVHEDIEMLLVALRKLPSLMVNLQVRYVLSPVGGSQCLLIEMGRHGAISDANPMPAVLSPGSTRSVTMDHAGVQHFLEAAAAHKAKIVSAPKLNLCNGQSFSGNTETQARDAKPNNGSRYGVRSVVSPDRRSVRLELKFEHFANEGPIERTTKAAAVFTVPDHRTLVWHLGATTGGEHLFVLVTPRVLVREEEKEPIFLGNIPPIPGR